MVLDSPQCRCICDLSPLYMLVWFERLFVEDRPDWIRIPFRHLAILDSNPSGLRKTSVFLRLLTAIPVEFFYRQIKGFEYPHFISGTLSAYSLRSQSDCFPSIFSLHKCGMKKLSRRQDSNALRASSDLLHEISFSKSIFLTKLNIPSVEAIFNFVGETGLEPATSRTPCARASQLRYSPYWNLYHASSCIIPHKLALAWW